MFYEFVLSYLARKGLLCFQDFTGQHAEDQGS